MAEEVQLTPRERLALWAYLAVMNTVGLIAVILAFPFLMLKEKRRRTVPARLGFQRIRIRQHPKPPVWIHALSLGEVLSCVSLVKALRERLNDRAIVFSASTLSGMQIAKERLLEHVDTFLFFPLDFWWPAMRALRRVRPSLMVFVETDLWPGFQTALRHLQTPAVLVNGRLSPNTYAACLRLRGLFTPALNTFVRIHPQSDQEAKRYRDVGVLEDRIAASGNLKFDQPLATAEHPDTRKVCGMLAGGKDRLTWLAGSTHPGEEEIIRRVFLRLRQAEKTVRLIMVPRHPARGREVCELFVADDIRCGLFSERTGECDVVVVDAMGLLSSLYRYADIAFIGGSMVGKGGQNPIEAAAVGTPVLFGPHMEDFPDVSRELLTVKSARQVNDETDLHSAIIELVENPEARREMGRRGTEMVASHSGATARLVKKVELLLETEK